MREAGSSTGILARTALLARMTALVALALLACVGDGTGLDLDGRPLSADAGAPGMPSMPELPPADDAGVATDDAGTTTGSGYCDSAPATVTVDRYVWAENYVFSFRPAGADPKVLYVPANAQVRFQLAGSADEESHTLEIVIPGCATPTTSLGMVGAEARLVW